jgi:hypothetical protein
MNLFLEIPVEGERVIHEHDSGMKANRISGRKPNTFPAFFSGMDAGIANAWGEMRRGSTMTSCWGARHTPPQGRPT